jgi:hypothetical protein
MHVTALQHPAPSRNNKTAHDRVLTSTGLAGALLLMLPLAAGAMDGSFETATTESLAVRAGHGLAHPAYKLISRASARAASLRPTLSQPFEACTNS